MVFLNSDEILGFNFLCNEVRCGHILTGDLPGSLVSLEEPRADILPESIVEGVSEGISGDVREVVGRERGAKTISEAWLLTLLVLVVDGSVETNHRPLEGVILTWLRL